MGEWGPDTHYATAGEISVAYQVMGDGPVDLLWISGWLSNVEVIHEHPRYERFLQRLASFSRLIFFDKRGVGLSDPVPLQAVPSLDEQLDDVMAVLDAVGSDQAAVLGTSEGGPLAIMFAASHPDRVTSLVLLNTFARLARADDYPFGIPHDRYHRFLDETMAEYGTSFFLELVSPESADDAFTRDWRARLRRQAGSPRTARAMSEMVFDLDVRDVLRSVTSPTLILHRRDDRYVRAAHGKYLAEHIRDATYTELPGEDHTLAAALDAADDIQEFLTGTRTVAAVDRILTTILYTDLVRSTELAAKLGDRRWRERLDRHDEHVRRQLSRYRGRLVHGTGDGVLAMFDGPGRAIACALAIRDGVRALGLEVRAGIHTGEVEIRGDDIGGIAVHIGARVVASAADGEVVVSSSVPALVTGAEIRFADRGLHELKGVPGTWRLFAVEG